MSKVEALKKQSAEWEREIQLLTSRLTNARSNQNSVVKEIENDTREYERLSSKIKELIKANQNLGQEYERKGQPDDAIVAQMNPIINEAKSIDLRQKEIVRLIKQKEAQLEQLNDQYKNTSDPGRKRNIKAEHERIQSEIRELLDEHKMLQKRYDQLNVIITPLKNQHEAIEKELFGIKSKMETNYNNKIKLDAQIKTYAERISKNEGRNNSMLAEINPLTEQIKGLQRKLRAINVEIDSLERQAQATYDLLLAYLKTLPKVVCKVTPHPICTAVNIIDIADTLYDYGKILGADGSYDEKVTKAFYELVKLYIEKKFEPAIGAATPIVMKNIEYALQLLREVPNMAPSAASRAGAPQMH